MRVSADIERCPHCHQPLPAGFQPEDPPSRLIVWIVGAWVIAAVILLIVL